MGETVEVNGECGWTDGGNNLNPTAQVVYASNNVEDKLMSRSRFRFAVIMLASALVFGAQVLGTRARASGPQSNDDSTIVSDIQAKLFDDSVLKTRDIHVASQDGVVTLSGTVNTDLEKAAVDRIASRESGVKKVVDGLATGAGVEVAFIREGRLRVTHVVVGGR